MKIVCPQCAFERHVPEDRLPASSVIATCPHCQHRFRIQRPSQTDAAQDGDAGIYQQRPQAVASPVSTQPTARQTSQPVPPSAPVQKSPAIPAPQNDEDDPLPPGAVIPGREDTEVPPIAQSTNAAAPPAAPAPRASSASSAPAQPPAATPTSPSDKPKESLGWHSVKAPDTPDMPDENDVEFRRAAAAAYEKHAEEGEQDFALDNPWEQPEKDGYAASFYQTCVRVMFTAPRFFSGLHPDTPQRSALFFFLLVCVIQTLVERFWGGVFHSYFAPAAGNDPQLQQLLSLLAPQTSILMSLLMNAALKTLELFLASGLFFLAFKLLAPAKANYQLVFQVMAYSSAPALLCVVPVAGSVAGFIWGLACSLVGCRYALRLTWPQTILGVVPMYAIGIVIFLRMVTSLQQAGIG